MAPALLTTEQLQKAFDDAASAIKKRESNRLNSLAALLPLTGDATNDGTLVLVGIHLGQLAAAQAQLGALTMFDQTLKDALDQAAKTSSEVCTHLGRETCRDGPRNSAQILEQLSEGSKILFKLLQRLQLIQQLMPAQQMAAASGGGEG